MIKIRAPWLDNEWGEAFLEEVSKDHWYANWPVGPAARKWKCVPPEVSLWLVGLLKDEEREDVSHAEEERGVEPCPTCGTGPALPQFF